MENCKNCFGTGTVWAKTKHNGKAATGKAFPKLCPICKGTCKEPKA